MPRKTMLNEFEKGQILAYHAEGRSFREISRIINRSVSVVSNYLKNPSEYGKNKRSGRPSKLSLRDTRRIIKRSSNSSISCNQLKEELGLSVSRWTVNRVISRSPKLIRSRFKMTPALKAKHKVARMKFARKHMSSDWAKVYYILLLSLNLILDIDNI